MDVWRNPIGEKQFVPMRCVCGGEIELFLFLVQVRRNNDSQLLSYVTIK